MSDLVKRPTPLLKFFQTFGGLFLLVFFFPSHLDAQCPVFTNITRSDARCGEINGFVSFEFENDPAQSSIAFSLDGGISYPLQVSTSEQFAIFEGLAPGTYELFTRWSDGSCTTDLGVVVIGDQPPPVVAVASEDYACGADTGRIDFSFGQVSGRESIEFSLDSGLTYPFFAPTDQGTVSIGNLAPGTYELFARWGNQDCPTSLGPITLSDVNGNPPKVTVQDFNNDCVGGDDDLALTMYFDDEPSQSIISFSLDGAENYDYNVADDSDSLRIDPINPGTYDIFTRWGDENCEEDLGVYAVGVPPSITVKSNNASCGFTKGSITFFYPEYVNKNQIQFSVDSGLSYTHSAPAINGNTTYTNLDVGTYHVFARWSDGTCPIDLGEYTIVISNGGQPNVSISTSEAICGPGSGAISFTFPTHPSRTSIQFSIDGGNSFPFTQSIEESPFLLSNVNPGTYSLVARWGNGDCPINLGSFTISGGSRALPEAIVVNRAENCRTFGRDITFAFEDDPSQSTLEFSNDGGLTFPLRVNDDTETATFINLDPGTYHLFVRWGDGLCPVDLGEWTVGNDEDATLPPTATYQSTNPTCINNDGSVAVYFDDSPDQDTLEFTLIGENVSRIRAGDDQDSVVFVGLSEGAYRLSVQWGDSTCPINLGLVTLGTDGDAGFPSISTSYEAPTCWGSPGSLSFSFSDNPEHDTLEVSFNGGLSYPLIFADDQGSITFSGFESGSYDLYARWSGGSCPISLGQLELSDSASYPEISYSKILPTCESPLGAITFQFSPSSDHEDIQFSLDNGSTYFAPVSDEIGEITYSNLGYQAYPVWGRWGDGSCPKFLGTVDFSQDSPEPSVDFVVSPPSCEASDGSIQFQFDAHNNHSQIEFSIDGGNTYPLVVNDALEMAEVSNLSPGKYELYARWGGQSCAAYVGEADLTQIAGRADVEIALQYPTCGNNDGRILFSFENNPDQSFIEFSLDGGNTYPLIVNDLLGFAAFTNVGEGIYDIYARWGDGSCPSSLGLVDMTQVEGLPEVTITPTSPSCGANDGIIRLNFEDNPEQSTIEFSMDGGATYPLIVNDALGITAFTNVAPGEYLLYARWGDGTCPSSLGVVDLTKIEGAPDVTVSTQAPTCGQSNGRINFSYVPDPDQFIIQFSLDGGATYPLTVNSTLGFTSFTNVSPGSYALYTRWGDGTCVTSLGTVDLSSPDQAPEVAFTVSSPSCESNTADIFLTFEDNPLQDSIQLSLDSGQTYAYRFSLTDTNPRIPDVPLEDFHLFARWGDGQCPAFVGEIDLRDVNEIPRAFFTISSPSCNGNDGIINFEFNDNPSRSTIEFSYDGGITYPLSVDDNSGQASFVDLEPGFYELAARWGGAECPIILGFADLTTVSGGPDVDLLAERSICGQSQGSVTLSFEDAPGRDIIEFSLDGGNSFPYSAFSNSGSLQINDLSSGLYDIYAQWGSGQRCPVQVGLADLSPSGETPEVSFEVQSSSSCEFQSGSIRFTFEDHPSLSQIEFSLDGGRSYVHTAADNLDSLSVSDLAPGTYEIYVRWDGDFCPTYLGNAEIELQAANPDLSFSLSKPNCNSTDGLITFSIGEDNAAIGDSIALSLDGGQTYPYVAPTNQESFSISAQAPGFYELYAKFSSGIPCAIRLGIADMSPLVGAPRVFFTQSSPSCENALGTLSFFFEDMLDQDSLQFSIDGGNTFPIRVSDLDGSKTITDISPDIYDIYVRTGDESCPLFMGIADLTQVQGAPEVSYTISGGVCGGEMGQIDFSYLKSNRRGDIELSLDGGNTYPYFWGQENRDFSLTDVENGEYDIFARWTSGNLCETRVGVVEMDPPVGSPISFFSISAPTTCESVDGIITFTFPEDSSHSEISFSLDGGFSYPLTVPIDQGTATIEGLTPDRYRLYSRWGDASCPLFLGVANLGSTSGQPEIDISFIAAECGTEEGLIQFDFSDHPSHESLEFSLDGGFSFPLKVADTLGSASFTGLGPGYYEPVVRWGDSRTCETKLGTVDLAPSSGIPFSTFGISNPTSCFSNDASITFFYEDFDNRTSLQFSIDGGHTFPIFVNDTSASVTINNLGSGLYHLYARWGNGACPLFLGIADIHPSITHPEVNYAFSPATCESQEGVIELTIENDPRHEYAEFSLDGGRSYTHKVKTSDGLLSISNLEPGVYDIYTRWAEVGACPVPVGVADLRDASGPIITHYAINTNSNCDLEEGTITLFYEENASRNNIKFSIDGGETFPYTGETASQQFTLSNLPNGYYDVVAAWGDNSCPVYVGAIEVATPEESPEVYFSVDQAQCQGNPGTLTFYFADNIGQDSIAFSLDGGITYPLVSADNSAFLLWENLEATVYDLWVRWGDGNCAMPLGKVDLNSGDLPELSDGLFNLTFSGPTCGVSDAWISFMPDSSSQLDSFRVSLDQGISWISFPDSSQSFRIDSLPAGSYQPLIDLSSSNCEVALDSIVLEEQFPQAVIRLQHAICGNPTGSMILNFPSTPYPEELLFSVDGGQTYPYQGSEIDSFIVIDNLPIGEYEVYAKWGHRECDTLLGIYSIGDSCDYRTLYGTVWNDEDRDGVFDPEETGVSGVSIALLNESSFFVASRVTDEDGAYQFSSLDSGVYFLSIVVPDGYELSPFQLPVEGIRGNDFNPLTNRTAGTLIPDTVGGPLDAGIMLNNGTVDCEKNLARGKASTQSSTLLQGIASFANDGDPLGDRGAIGPEANIAHTLEGENPWWQVDLGETSSIFDLKVWNRTDCCTDHLKDFHVFLSDSIMSLEVSMDSLLADTSIAHFQYQGIVDTVAELPIRAVGRYLRIQLEGSTFLSMAEVEAIGCVGIQNFTDPNHLDSTDVFTIRTYPIPASEFLIIEILNSPDGIDVYELELVDYRGRPVYLELVEPGIHTVSIEDFAKGLYVLKVRSELISETVRLIFR